MWCDIIHVWCDIIHVVWHNHCSFLYRFSLPLLYRFALPLQPSVIVRRAWAKLFSNSPGKGACEVCSCGTCIRFCSRMAACTAGGAGQLHSPAVRENPTMQPLKTFKFSCCKFGKTGAQKWSFQHQWSQHQDCMQGGSDKPPTAAAEGLLFHCQRLPIQVLLHFWIIQSSWLPIT